MKQEKIIERPTPSQSVDKRAEFEKWWCANYDSKSLSQKDNGFYLVRSAGTAWDAWQTRANLSNPQPTGQDVLDAERYRWLKPNYAMANFDIYDAEKGESKQSGIIFEMPDGLSYGADLDALIDAAMKEGKK